MPAIELITLLTLATILIVWARISALAIEAERKQQLLGQQSVGCHNSQGWVGCSVVCQHPRSVAHIESLLGTRYERYEVIVIIDATADEELFSAIVEQYGLIELNAPQQSASNPPAAAIRSLYRSKQRRYRPFVLLDIEQNQPPHHTLNSALMVASYNYVIPLWGNSHLRPHAIESIAITLADHSEQEIELLESLSSHPCQIFRYDAVVAKGGFSASLTDKIDPRKRLYTYEAYIGKVANGNTPSRLISRLSRHLSPRCKTLILTLITILCVAITATLWATTYHKIPLANATSSALGYELMALAALSSALAFAAISLHHRAACGATDASAQSSTDSPTDYSTKYPLKCSLRTIFCCFRRIRVIFLR